MLLYDVYYYRAGNKTDEMDSDVSYDYIKRAMQDQKPNEGLSARCTNGGQDEDFVALAGREVTGDEFADWKERCYAASIIGGHTSDKKAAASKANGAKGGRPRG